MTEEPKTPLGILERSIVHVKSNRYAYGVLGIVAAAFVAAKMLGGLGAVISVIVGLALMTALLLFYAVAGVSCHLARRITQIAL